MSDLQIGILGLTILIILLIMGMRVAYAITLVGGIGIIVIKGWESGTTFLGNIPSSVVGTYSYSAIPLFILMGYFAYYSRLTDDLYDVAKTWVQHIHGGLPAATVLASAGFATVSGSSSAATGVLAKMAIPQMVNSGVDRKLSAGTVAMGGCLAALIPPSTIMIVFGIITEQSIGKMLIAGIVPGILTVLLYILLIYTRVRINNSLAPTAPAFSWKERFKSLRKTIGLLILVILVIGGIYTGVFTPTEAAGVGAAGALILGLVLRRLSLSNIKMALMESVKISTMIFAIMVGVSALIRFLALAGVNTSLTNFIQSLPVGPMPILFIMLIIYLILGMFMDAISMMMITLPLFFPIIVELGFHPVWFGIVVVKMAEIGLVSPPVGLNCFIVSNSSSEVSLGQTFRGVVPFIFIELIVVLILILFPQIVTFLPDLMMD